jgi:hypothetical protein
MVNTVCQDAIFARTEMEIHILSSVCARCWTADSDPFQYSLEHARDNHEH